MQPILWLAFLCSVSRDGLLPQERERRLWLCVWADYLKEQSFQEDKSFFVFFFIHGDPDDCLVSVCVNSETHIALYNKTIWNDKYCTWTRQWTSGRWSCLRGGRLAVWPLVITVSFCTHSIFYTPWVYLYSLISQCCIQGSRFPLR